jgi:hypothetical protein
VLPARCPRAALGRLILHPAERLVGSRALACSAVVAILVHPRGALAGGAVTRTAGCGIRGRLPGEWIVERLPGVLLARGLARGQLGLQGGALDVAEWFVIGDHQRRESRDARLRTLQDALGDTHARTVASIS